RRRFRPIAISSGRARHGSVIIRPQRTRPSVVELAVVFTPVVRKALHFSAPIRRFGGSTMARTAVLIVGLAAVTAYTVPDLQRAASGWLMACLWSCLVYFAIDGAIRANAALQAGKIWTHLLSFSGLIDIVAVIAVPIALLCGVPSA